MSERKKYINVALYYNAKFQGSFTTTPESVGDSIVDQLIDLEDKGYFELSPVWMTEEEYENLPEFEGF